MWDTRIKYEISQVEHFIFSPCLHQEKYLRIQMSAFDIFTQPPQLPKKRPLLTMSLPVTVASQFASLSPLALSSSLLTTARSDLPPGSFLRPAAVQSRRQLPRWFSSWYILSQWTGRASPLPPPSHMPAPAACTLPRPSLTPVCVLCQKLHQNVQRRHRAEKWCWDAGWSGRFQSDSISYQLLMLQSCTPAQLQWCVSPRLSRLALADTIWWDRSQSSPPGTFWMCHPGRLVALPWCQVLLSVLLWRPLLCWVAAGGQDRRRHHMVPPRNWFHNTWRVSLRYSSSYCVLSRSDHLAVLHSWLSRPTCPQSACPLSPQPCHGGCFNQTCNGLLKPLC